MKRHLPEEYNRRPKVKTVHSVIKIKSGSFVRSRIPELSEKEIAMKIIACNIRRIVVLNDSGIIFIIEDFYRADLNLKLKYSKFITFICVVKICYIENFL